VHRFIIGSKLNT
jgi:Uncharacterized protein conserved in bacteria